MNVNTEEKFQEIYDKYKNLVLKVAFDMTKDYYLAQDICQEVFEKVYRALQGLNSQNVRGWITVVTRLTTIDFLRKRSRRREEFLEDCLSPGSGKEPASTFSFEEEYERKEFRDELFLNCTRKMRCGVRSCFSWMCWTCRRRRWHGGWGSR